MIFSTEEFVRGDEVRPNKNMIVKPEDGKVVFAFRAPFDIKIRDIQFGDDFDMHGLFIGQQNVCVGQLGKIIPVTDFDNRTIPLDSVQHYNYNLCVEISSPDRPRAFAAKITAEKSVAEKVEKEASFDKLAKRLPLVRNAYGVVHIEGGTIDPGEIADIRTYPVSRFESEYMISDVKAELTLMGVEVGREQQIKEPVAIKHKTLVATSAVLTGQEIRLFVRNDTSKPVTFTGRLHGKAVL